MISIGAQAQYYYKDIISPAQTMKRVAIYKTQRIHSVNVMSYEKDGKRTEDFNGIQNISSDYTRISTSFKTPLSGESELTTFFDGGGRLVKSIDTADGSYSESNYFYNQNGTLSKITNISTSAGNKTEKEDHLWFYNANQKPEKMTRIKNDSDTTYVTFVPDENGNAGEENSTRRNVALPPYYYYYDEKNRLTDIVSYNAKAKRLLPLYIFEYDQKDQLMSMLIVPEGTDDYQKWVYEYNQQGLKVKETCLNKRRQILGRVEYQYK
ncbi:MAG TPA: hypothetical protein VM101_04185 [Flavitalea sp.]|nr:hypothetical protein [Flavitalea sp.]